jgi:hypothetical protein
MLFDWYGTVYQILGGEWVKFGLKFCHTALRIKLETDSAYLFNPSSTTAKGGGSPSPL